MGLVEIEVLHEAVVDSNTFEVGEELRALGVPSVPRVTPACKRV
ncbi:MAG: hypothetical protein ACRDXC_06350 [Acidimicrobiales bacterium]